MATGSGRPGWPATIDHGTAPQRKDRTMAGTLQNRIAGTVDDVKGRGKLAVGELIDNEDLKTAGRKDRATGAVHQAVADAKDKLDEVVTQVTGT
jgi:uncharacterized protein YjbJ (UPF0337 family)